MRPLGAIRTRAIGPFKWACLYRWATRGEGTVARHWWCQASRSALQQQGRRSSPGATRRHDEALPIGVGRASVRMAGAGCRRRGHPSRRRTEGRFRHRGSSQAPAAPSRLIGGQLREVPGPGLQLRPPAPVCVPIQGVAAAAGARVLHRLVLVAIHDRLVAACADHRCAPFARRRRASPISHPVGCLMQCSHLGACVNRAL